MSSDENGNSNPNSRNIIRQGYVTAVYPERHTCRAFFPDQDDLVSSELQIITPFAGGNKCYSMPDLGESIVVAYLGNDDSGGTGYVIGSVFNDKDTPNSSDHDETKINFSDGTSISYNRNSHKLEIKACGDVTIAAEGNVKITGKRIDLN